MHWRVSPGSSAPELDRRLLQPQAVGSEGRRRRRPGLALRQRQNPLAAHPATVPGRQHEDLQDHRGHLLQVQEVLQAAQRVRQQAGGAGRAAATAAAQAQGQEPEEAGQEAAGRQLARARTLRAPCRIFFSGPELWIISLM